MRLPTGFVGADYEGTSTRLGNGSAALVITATRSVDAAIHGPLTQLHQRPTRRPSGQRRPDLVVLIAVPAAAHAGRGSTVPVTLGRAVGCHGCAGAAPAAAAASAYSLSALAGDRS